MATDGPQDVQADIDEIRDAPARRRRVSRRRKGWGEDRRARKSRKTVGCWSISFAFPADASVPIIFKNYTTIGEFLPDAVGGSEIATLAGGLAFGDKFFDFCIAQASAFDGVAEF